MSGTGGCEGSGAGLDAGIALFGGERRPEKSLSWGRCV